MSQLPPREQFRNLIAAIRHSDGRKESQAKAQAGTDLVELLAYTGCSLNEGISLTWADADFEKGTIRVTGGDLGTKNSEERTVPMTGALRQLLLRLQESRKPKPTDRINETAKKCLATACKRMNYPLFTHHDFRRLFATTCVESGVDIPTMSPWLGHSGGGALAMRVYGHLRQEHSMSMVGCVKF